MATGQWPNIIDVANRLDPEGNIPTIAELMSQCNDFMDYLPMVEANGRTFHEFVFRTSIPAGFWVQYNQGVPYSKSTTARARVSVGTLRDYSQIDQLLAEDSGDPVKFRESEDVAFLEGMAQTLIQTAIYGNPVTNPASFAGFSIFYNTVTAATAATAANVLDGGGTGTANTTLWLLGFGENAIHGVYPMGSKVGLHMDDKGSVVPGFDAVGNRFEAYTSLFQARMGVVPKDWRYGAAIRNLDVTAAGLAGPAPFDLWANLDRLVLKFPKMTTKTSGVTKTDAPNEGAIGGVRPVIFVNRTLKHFLHVQAMRNFNVRLTLDQAQGGTVQSYRGEIPIAVVDQILNTEAQVV